MRLGGCDVLNITLLIRAAIAFFVTDQSIENGLGRGKKVEKKKPIRVLL